MGAPYIEPTMIPSIEPKNNPPVVFSTTEPLSVPNGKANPSKPPTPNPTLKPLIAFFKAFLPLNLTL